MARTTKRTRADATVSDSPAAPADVSVTVSDSKLQSWIDSNTATHGKEAVNKAVQLIIQEVMHAHGNFDVGIPTDGVWTVKCGELVNKYYTLSALLKIQEKLWSHCEKKLATDFPVNEKFRQEWWQQCYNNK